jgi:hypothetical protein
MTDSIRVPLPGQVVGKLCDGGKHRFAELIEVRIGKPDGPPDRGGPLSRIAARVIYQDNGSDGFVPIDQLRVQDPGPPYLEIRLVEA